MIQSVKVKNLSLSKDNVRKCKRAVSVEAMAASIAAQGLLQNLIVTPLKKAGTYTVKGGGVRLRALQLLIEQGTLAPDHEVPVLVLAIEDNSVEASLAENLNRTPMNPTDECDTFKPVVVYHGQRREDRERCWVAFYELNIGSLVADEASSGVGYCSAHYR